MEKMFLYISLLFFTALGSMSFLYNSNDTYTKVLKQKNDIFNLIIDKGDSNKNLLELISYYVNNKKRTKVFLIPSLDDLKSEFEKKGFRHRNEIYFIFITPNVSNVEEYTDVIKDYNTRKYEILKKINLDETSVFVFEGYKGFVKEILLN